MTETRVACPSCGALILERARKCKACKRWIRTSVSAASNEPRIPRAALAVAMAVVTVMAVLVTGRESPVGQAPPLTALAGDVPAAEAGAPSLPSPGAIGPEPEVEPERPSVDVTKPWRTREIRIGEVHPLDIVWSPSGESIYVSADDGTLREYKLKTGELVHQASVPAQGDHLRLLFGRYVAVLRHEDAARIPVMDTTTWDHDPMMLDVGQNPGDIIELLDKRTVVAASIDGKRVTRFDLPSGKRLDDITLPHATGQLFVVRAEKRPYVAAMGALTHAGEPAGAWLDLFDPTEMPFGATRRSIPVGREPRPGAVTADGSAIFFPDRAANVAVMLKVAGITEAKQVAVDPSPEAAFLMDDDRYGVTINGAARTASVIALGTMTLKSTLMLAGVPCSGEVSRDRRTLFVSLGGAEKPPKGSGVAVIVGDPPKVVASLPTGKGACAVAVSNDGTRAAVATYFNRSITIVEQ